MESKKIYNNLVKIIKKKQTHINRGQTSGYQWGEGRGEGALQGLGTKRYKLLYKISYRDILYNTGNIANIL